MARRSDHSREEIRSMAISAGRELIEKKGFSELSARKIAKEIGYTVGTIYNVFETHEMLILAMNAVTLEHMHDYIVKRQNKALLGEEAIQQLADLYVAYAKKNYNQWNALFLFNLPHTIQLPDWYAENIDKLFNLIEKPLLPICNGDAHKAEQSAKTIWACIHGICQLELSGKLTTVKAESAITHIHSLIKNYLYGLVNG